MTAQNSENNDHRASPFRRDFFEAANQITYLGSGDFGGKAMGLGFVHHLLEEDVDDSPYPGIEVSIPRMLVLRTSIFDSFMERNDLWDLALSEASDHQIANSFQKTDFPDEIIGDLYAFAQQVTSPLAVRSSSKLEDAMFQPFAGVYGTKMIPNHQSEPDTRFRKLLEAIKYVYASTFFQEAKAYIRHTGEPPEEEKMAVILQEVVGERHHDRFYPTLSGVARSWNYYAVGRANPEDGVVDLALGLGKTIVDGGVVWTYSPAWPKLAPPVGSTKELLNSTQTTFWAVNMGETGGYDPTREEEYLIKAGLKEAEYDNQLRFIASTYDPTRDRLLPGTGPDGPRAITFARILQLGDVKLNDLLIRLLRRCEEALGEAVEMEFACSLHPKNGTPARFGFLQLRPMVVFTEKVELDERELDSDRALVASEKVLGNGVVEKLCDIIYVRPSTFEAKHTPEIAREIERLNRALEDEGRPSIIIGFGRWGSSDPWLGTPVVWSQVTSAKVIVEATLPEMNVDLSQGSHFFHNLSAFRVLYFSVSHTGPYPIDWDWLEAHEPVHSGDYVRHVRTEKPLTVKVDGRTARGVILHE